MFKLEERDEKSKSVEEELRVATRRRNEAQTESQTIRRQLNDLKTLFEEEVREKQEAEHLLELAAGKGPETHIFLISNLKKL